MSDFDRLAAEAESILTSDLWQNTIQEMRTGAFEVIEHSAPEDSEQRESAYRDLQAIKRIETRLKGHLDNLKLAKAGKLRERTR